MPTGPGTYRPRPAKKGQGPKLTSKKPKRK